ncbi:hypothetical protein SAMN05421741_11331 [Paenimyroides ummariense]|uniref:Erythromycin esterase homolog n=1 Tax=Paenimyroides ummariense TaxID=913024 RepID=A0A1I5CRI8_9FLAO|nr:hypothetical protein [Paenimyroides ummariense]SFN89562.1 hypothetical protein SAMN05421741_11331 [Paenimyroides ummariense]
MKNIITIFIIAISLSVYPQSKKAYLKQNRLDVEKSDFKFPQTDFNIIGFGAYHGSAKTYDAELQLIKSLKKQNALDYYIPETSFSQAFFFQKYLETADEELLKKLVLAFQTIVNQEGTIETFEHWKSLRLLNESHKDNPIKVIGFDVVNEYYFPIKHILYLTENIENWKLKEELRAKLSEKNFDFSISNKETTQLLKNLITDYNMNKNLYVYKIKDTVSFNHILKNINYNFEESRDREKIIVDNYIYLKDIYHLETRKQFAKYGFFHLEKEREQNYPSFFTRLIEQNVYKRDKVITVIGYLTKSEVLWDKIYDKQKNYKTYTVEKGYGIGDYWREYFKGIKNLKKTKLSDITLYKLNEENSPYNSGTDLKTVKLFLKRSNSSVLKGKATTDYIDYAILIRNSKNQIPIEEMK